jgi:hypothetical protein
MISYPKPIRNVAIECIAPDAPAALGSDGRFVRVEHGTAPIDRWGWH